MYPVPAGLVLLRGLVSPCPVALGIPPQSRERGNSGLWGERSLKTESRNSCKLYWSSLPLRDHARQGRLLPFVRLLPFIEHQTRKRTQSSSSYFFLPAGSFNKRGVALEGRVGPHLQACSLSSMLDICIR